MIWLDGLATRSARVAFQSRSRRLRSVREHSDGLVARIAAAAAGDLGARLHEVQSAAVGAGLNQELVRAGTQTPRHAAAVLCGRAVEPTCTSSSAAPRRRSRRGT